MRRIEDLPYPAGDVELLDEDEDEDDPDAADPEAGDARERYADLVERVTDTRPTQEDLAQLDAYAMAATLDFALDAKQDLLELRSERLRLQRLGELFASTIKRLEQAEQTAEVAQGNGHLRTSG
jgi:hypothetical protein